MRRVFCLPSLPFLVAGSLIALAAPAVHAYTGIAGADAGVSSSTEKLISYRHQEHMWRTSDGRMHAVLNRGAQTANPGLTLYSSADGGATWTPAMSFAGTSEVSTADGVLRGDNLTLVWNNTNGGIEAGIVQYNTTTHAWTYKGKQLVLARSGAWAGQNASVAFDSAGNAWAAVVRQNLTTSVASIRVLMRLAGASTWADSSLTFGPMDASQPARRSARLVPTSTGMGLVYAVRDSLYWQERPLAGAVNLPWNAAVVIHTSSVSDTDPMSSHFSVARDGAMNLHLAFADNGSALYARRDAATGLWSAPRTLISQANVGYLQLSWVGGGAKLALVANVGASARVLQSSNYGSTWLCTHRLTHAEVSGADYGYPRLETPGTLSQGPIPVLQQYVLNGVQRALAFSVPVSSTEGCK